MNSKVNHFVPSDGNTKNENRIKKGYHCYNCGRVALLRGNLNKMHSSGEASGCAYHDVSECLLVQDSETPLSLHSSPCISYFQSQHPLWLPDIYGTKKEVEAGITKPTFRERLRKKIKLFRLRAGAYRKRREGAGTFFAKGRRRYVPFTFYKEVRKATYSDNTGYVYGSPYCRSVDDAKGLPEPNSSPPKIIDMTNKHDLELEIHLGGGKVTKVKILNASDRIQLVNEVVQLGDAAVQSKFEEGHVRTKKDLGRMFGFGFNWNNWDFYPTCRDSATQEIMKKVCSQAEELLIDHFQSELFEILHSEHEQGRGNISFMGLVGSKIMLSVDLVNSCHLDASDQSRSVAIWVESIPGSTENWYFILPYVSFRGSCGVAIKLFHGCTISWDATVLYHCSTFSNNVQGGHAYGCMFGSCVGKSNTNA